MIHPRMLLALLFLAASFSCCLSQEKFESPFYFQFKKVREAIYVAYRPEPLRYIVEGNCTIIINDGGVVVVDATGSPQGAGQIIDEIKKITDQPVKYLINTHGHGDHTIGKPIYRRRRPFTVLLQRLF